MANILVTESVNGKSESYGGHFFKDVLEFGIRGEAQKIQLQVVDGKGSVKAESQGLFSPGIAVDLLKRLPLPLSSKAPQWLKECLGGNCLAINFTKEAKC